LPRISAMTRICACGLPFPLTHAASTRPSLADSHADVTVSRYETLPDRI
jgi:hypothetical protein